MNRVRVPELVDDLTHAGFGQPRAAPPAQSRLIPGAYSSAHRRNAIASARTALYRRLPG